MRRRHFLLLLVLNFVPCLCYGVQVIQEPKLLLVQTEKSVDLHCQHNDNSYYNMLWYQQKPGEGLKLMVLSINANEENMEEAFKSRWNLKRSEVLKSTLILTSANIEDSALYFCASSIHSHRELSNSQHKTTAQL
ncbi:hypothetical protein FKM82_014761, partial [Ascaphus truei]